MCWLAVLLLVLFSTRAYQASFAVFFGSEVQELREPGSQIGEDLLRQKLSLIVIIGFLPGASSGQPNRPREYCTHSADEDN